MVNIILFLVNTVIFTRNIIFKNLIVCKDLNVKVLHLKLYRRPAKLQNDRSYIVRRLTCVIVDLFFYGYILIVKYYRKMQIYKEESVL